MISIYKKCEKALSNPSGIKRVDVQELNKPFLLCLSAQDFMDKSVFGTIREGAHAARLYTTQELAGGFKINNCPVDFLGLKFKSDEKYQYNYEEIVDEFLWPYLIQNGVDLESLKKTAKKMNFMTYCDGTMTYGKIENRLEEKLNELDFKEEDIRDILSNLSLVAIGTMVNTKGFKTTTASFVDVNDSEIFSEYTDGYNELLSRYGKKSLYGKNGKNSVTYIYKGTGNHSLKEYLADNRIVKPALSSIVSYFLEKSLASEKDSFVKTSINDIISRLKVYGDESKNPSELLTSLDLEISYDNTPRYTPEMLDIRKELDATCKELMKSEILLSRAKHENDEKEEKMKTIISNIEKYSSDTTLLQILVNSGMWRNARNSDALFKKSDRDIREEYEKIKEMSSGKTL